MIVHGANAARQARQATGARIPGNSALSSIISIPIPPQHSLADDSDMTLSPEHESQLVNQVKITALLILNVPRFSACAPLTLAQLDTIEFDGETNDENREPKTSREHLRDIAKSPKKRKRVKTSDTKNSTYEQSFQVALDVVDRRARWLYFLEFQHEQSKEKMLSATLSPHWKQDSWEYREARIKVQDACKGYKQRMLLAMEHHVLEMLAIDQGEGGSGVLEGMDSGASLAKYFNRKFSKENFLRVFSFIDGYVDFDNSTLLGQFYMKNIYANLASKTKMHLDWRAHRSGRANDRESIIKFVDTMALAKEYDNVTKAEFEEIFDRAHRQRRKKKTKDVLLPDDDPDVLIIGRPPPPKAPVAATTTSTDTMANNNLNMPESQQTTQSQWAAQSLE
ncbi:MAG: hypothetical protein M4579_006980 [Chaenotheca gracillima]|nr:MAG: hypothetical protein M4579_006980 [Chaenotheca gracillima]